MEKLLIKPKFKLLLLILTIIIGFFIRFYQLGDIPSSMNRDEPAIGYNAYSILQTGKDEWGKKFPLSFKSFGDFKSPLYIYLTVLPVKLFGLNEFSVRFWAALAGSLMLPLTYFLIRGLFLNSKKTMVKKKEIIIQLLVLFLLAISPWAIFYSRFSFEAILALFLNIFIFYFLALKNFKKIDFKTIFVLILSYFTYSSSFIIWPIFFAIWFIILGLKSISKKSLNNKKLFFSILLILIFSLLFFINQVGFGEQKGRITIFGNPQIRLDFNQLRTDIEKKSFLRAKLFYNQYIYYGAIFLKNSIKSFSPNFLFGSGGSHPWHKIPIIPHLYPVFTILILIGIVCYLKNKQIVKEVKFFTILFVLLSLVPSGITTDAPHATRLLNFFFWLTVFAGFGLSWLLEKFKLIGIIILLLLTFNFFQFSKAYFVDYKKNPPGELLPGLREAVWYLNNSQPIADKIIFDKHNDSSYIYVLFYTSYPPADFFNKVKRYNPDTAGLEWVEYFDKFLFVSNPRPDNRQTEIYVSGGDRNLGGQLIKKFTSQYHDEVYYTISANF